MTAVFLKVLAQTGLLLVLAPLVSGLIKTLKARMQMRRGPDVLQPYRDLHKLLRKGMVIPNTASWLFSATPYVVFLATLLAGLMVPMVAAETPVGLFGGVLAMVYLLGLGRFFLALGGLDTGSPFGGLGSSREMTISALAEPTLMLAVFTVAIGAGSTNLAEIAGAAIGQQWRFLAPSQILACAALFLVLIAETGRIPVDNPATHLELTMIHEAMILEYSGPYLALVEWGAWIKQLLLMTLLINVFWPFGLPQAWSASGLLAGIAWLGAKLFILSCGIVLVETANAKMRLFRVPELMAVAFVLGALALVSTFLFEIPMDLLHNPEFGDKLVTLMAALVLVLQIAMVGQRSLIMNIRVFGTQSFLLGCIAGAIAWYNSAPHIFIAAVMTVLVKAILVPVLLERLVERMDIRHEIEPIINVPVSIVISGGLTLVAYLVGESFYHPEEGAASLGHNTLAVAISVFLIGFFMMLNRRKALTQVVALLCLENGVFLAAICLTYGMPLIVELGVFFDVLVGVLVLGILVYRIRETFDSMDVSKLRRLRG